MKNYSKVFLYIFTGMLIISFSGSGNYLNGIDQRGDDPGNIKSLHHNKLVGPLKEIVNIYRNEKRLTTESLLKYGSKKLQNIIKGAKITAQPAASTLSKEILSYPPKRGKVNLSTGDILSEREVESKFKRPFFISALIRDELQERWGNPPYDVIECNIDMTGGIQVLNNFNLKIRATSVFEGKTIVSAEVASTEIEKIAKLSQVIRITPVLKKVSQNDLASNAVRASRIRLKSGPKYTKGYTGKGVIVGVIDSGIDWTHEDFVDPDTGETRIRYIWDTEITTPGRTPADVFGGVLSGLSYGTVWTKAEIDGGSCTEVDTNGHGTHVSGSAAGNGFATGKYTGIAPNSDIIFVKGLDNNGILFIYELSSQLGMSCSVNMSYGPGYPMHYMSWWPQDFPADGTSSEAQEIAGWNIAYGGGHIPVKSAGNEGHWNTYTDLTGGSYPYMNGSYHMEGHQSSGAQSHTYTVVDYATVWPYNLFGGPNGSIFPWLSFGYWSDAPIQITFTSPNGNVIGPLLHGTDGGTSDGVGDGWIEWYMDNPPASNGDYYGSLDLFVWWAPYQPAQGNWTITVEAIGGGSVNYDVWCAEFIYAGGYYVNDINSYFTGNFSHSNYIIDEGASKYEISVGAWSTRDKWDGSDGNTWTYAKKPWVGTIADFSSPGPSRDRRVKPDIAAPGQIIISAASSDAGWNPSDLDPDGEHGQMSGTSMSAPITTGAVALVLQKFPDRNVNQVRGLFSNWAIKDNATRTMGQDAFGSGKLNVLPLNRDAIAVLTQDRTEVILDNADKSVNFDGSESYDPEDFPITYLWVLEDIPDGADPEFIIDNDKATLNVDPEIEGMYRVSLAINDTIWDGPKTYSQWITAKFLPVLPPAGVNLERVVNNLIFVNEYVNRITWMENPENQVELLSYRVYGKVKGNGDDTYELIAELDPTVMGYDDRGLEEDQYFTYKITAVSFRGKESDPVIVSN